MAKFLKPKHRPPAPTRVPGPDELWRRSKGDGATYLALLHEHGYYSWPLYNRAPEGADSR